MIKNYLYAGLAILIIAIVAFFLSSQYVTIGSPTTAVNVTALPGGIAYAQIHMNASSVAVVVMNSYQYTNFYILNKSTFAGLVAYLNANDLRSGYGYIANAMVGQNDTFLNTTTAFGSIYQIAQNTPYNYTEYAVVDNSKGSYSTNSTVSATIVYKGYDYSSGLRGSLIFLVPVVGIILGFALIVYSFAKKPAEEAPPIKKPKSKGKRKGKK